MNDPSKLIDDYLKRLPIWQSELLTLFRDMIHAVSPTVAEEWKWNVPVFYVDKKMLFAMSAFKDHIKLNFIYNGAVLTDVNSLFNNGFEAKSSRSIDIKEGQSINGTHLIALISLAVETAKNT